MGVSAAVVGAGAAVASAASSISKGSSASSGANAAGQQAANETAQAAALWQNLQAPNLTTTGYQGDTWLQDFVPETYNVANAPGLVQMTPDTTDQASEEQALAQLQGFAKGGLQPADIAALQQIQEQQAGAATSANKASLAQIQAQGGGGAGASLAAALAGNQTASNNANSSYVAAMQAALQRQLSAVGSAGTLAGNITTQQDQVSQQMAANANAFNENLQQLQTTAAANAANVRNQAMAANEAGRQTTANEDTQISNQNNDLARQIEQQNFANQIQLTSGQSNAYNQQATQADASQSALSKQAVGDSQDTTAAINGLIGAAKVLSPTTTTSANGSTTTNGTSGGNFLSSIFGSGSSDGGVESGNFDDPSTQVASNDSFSKGGLIRRKNR